MPARGIHSWTWLAATARHLLEASDYGDTTDRAAIAEAHVYATLSVAAAVSELAEQVYRLRPDPRPGEPGPLVAKYRGPMLPEYPCRKMPTRHCPASFDNICGPNPCARYESDDETPWLPELALYAEQAARRPPWMTR